VNPTKQSIWLAAALVAATLLAAPALAETDFPSAISVTGEAQVSAPPDLAELDAGVASDSDVAFAQTQLQTTRSQLIDLGVMRAQLEHAIATLIGESASTFALPANATQLFATYAFDIAMGAGQLGLGASIALAMLPALALLIVALTIYLRRE